MNSLPTEVSRAIRGCVSIGPGDISNLCINGELVQERVVWKKYCILDPQYGGLICDDELVARITTEDRWSVDVMNNHGTTYNSIDSSLIDNVEEAKRKTAKRGKVL